MQASTCFFAILAYVLAAQSPGSTARELEDTLARARFSEILGYVLGALSILTVVAYIPIRMLLERKKHSRQQVQQVESRPTDRGTVSSNPFPRCSNCNRSLRIPETAIGKRCRCPNCGHQFVAERAQSGDAITSAPDRGKRVALPRDFRRETGPPLTFQVRIKDPERTLRGQFEVRLTAEGLLRQKKQEWLVAEGSEAEYLGGNRLSVVLESRRVELTIAKLLHAQNRLARDVAAYLNGDGPPPQAEDYKLPWYLFVPVVLPLGIPVLTLGGAIPAAVGVGLAGASFAIVQKDDWSRGARIGASLGLALVGYLAVFAFLAVIVGGWPGPAASPRSKPKVSSPPVAPAPVALFPPSPPPAPVQPPPPPPVPPGERRVWRQVGGQLISVLAFSPDGATLAVGHREGMVRLWDVAGSRERALFATNAGSVDAIAFSKSGTRLATGGANGRVLLWDPATGARLRGFQVLHTQTQDRDRVTALAFTPDDKGLAVGVDPGSGTNGEVHLWDLEADKERATSPNFDKTVMRLVFAPDRTLVVLLPTTVKVCDPATLQVRREIQSEEEEEGFIASAVSPDGQTVATLDGSTLQLWRLSSGACLHTWPVKASVIHHAYFPLTFSPDGKVLALGGNGPTLYFWDAQTGKELKVVPLGGSSGTVYQLTFSPDGQLLALYSNNGPKILEVPPLLGHSR